MERLRGGEACRFGRSGRAAHAQDRPAHRLDEFRRAAHRVVRAIVCEQLQSPCALIDRSEILDVRHRKRTRCRCRGTKRSAGKREAVAFRGFHEELLLRGRDFVDQRTKHVAEPIPLVRIALIDTRDVPPKLHATRSVGSAGIFAETNIRAGKCAIELTHGNRSSRGLEDLERFGTERHAFAAHASHGRSIGSVRWTSNALRNIGSPIRSATVSMRALSCV
jgi:hypothetical protein